MTAKTNNASPAPLAIVTNESETVQPNPTVKPNGEPITYSDIIKARKAREGVGKSEAVSETRQLLARFNDMVGEAGLITSEAASLSNRAAFLLSSTLMNGDISEPEVTAIMGDIFGYAPKKDGTPGKTPNKAGDAIRKRVFRAGQLAAFVNSDGKEVSTFFEGLSLDSVDDKGNTVRDVLNGVKSGEIPVFTAYDFLTKIKSNNRVKVSPAYDAKVISNLADDLATLDSSVAAIMGNAQLLAAYEKLAEVWATVNAEAGRIEMEREAA